ncbi:Gamma-tubulin complex component protein [Phytophthora cactorum]|nr:Gamma-tubulin complex component protein [Phytophthora cactorum]
MQDEPPPPPPPPPVDSRSRSLSSNPAVPGPLRAGGRAPTFSELRATVYRPFLDDDPLSPRTRLEMEKQRQAMGKTTATSSGLNTSAANTSNTTPTNHSSTRSTPRSSSFYSVSSSLEFAPTGGRRFDLQTQHRNPSNQLSPHRAMLSRVDSLLGSQPPSGPSPGASSQYGGASFVATHSMYSASSTSTSPSLATSTRTFHRERGEEQREPSSCGAEILYNSPIRLRLSSRQCLRISAVKDSNHQSHATSHFPPRPTGSGTGTGGSAGIARTSRPLTTVQINVSGDGLDGDADQIFVLQNTALRSDCGEVHYSDIFLSVDPATQTLTMKKGPVISNSEKWRLVNPISEGREDYPVNNQDSFASVDAASRLWGQQKAIATSDSVMLKMNTAELYLSVRPDRYGQDDSAGTHTASVVLSKENDGINDTMQVWKVTKSNLPYDPEWNRERPYLTGEAFVQPQAKRHHTADDGDLNLPPLSTYPPSVQESIIVDDLLYVLLGVEGRYIKLAVTETRGVDAARSTRTFKFGLNQPGMDPSLLTLASRCLSLGEFYLNLSLYIEQFSRYEYGQVSHAFCAALKTLKLWYNVQPSLRTLEMLSLLVDGCRKTIGGGSLLSEIQRIMSSLAGDSNARKVFSFLMERASVPYLKMVERWIYHGDLVDPYDEFMIRRDDQVSKEDVQDNPYSTYWQSRYTIRASQVPLFLSRVAQKILTAGKYLNVFRTCSRQVDCPFAGEIVFSPSESVYEELIDKAHGFASRVLLDLFVRENDLLISLKHYFLMDQGDFFVDFMDVAEVELKLRADKLSLPRLESLLHLSLQTSTCSSDPYKDDLQCFLSPHNLISHMEAIHQRAQKGPRDSLTTFESSSIGHPGYKVIDAFTLDYNVKWPLSLVISCGALTKYQMIFRHIFFCKHVERQLCDAWMNHQATKELSLRAALGPSFCLRQRMLHFQQNFVYYMMFEVISPRWHDFQQQLASAGTVDDILEFQGEFLDICLKECLLTDPEFCAIESYTRPYFLDEETIKAEREAERDRRAEKKAREEAEVALASYQRQKGTFGGKKKGGVLRRRQSSQVDMRRTRIRELSDDVKRALTEREGDEENPFVRMTNDLENQFDSLLGEFMQQLLRRSLLQQNSHLSNLCTRLDYNGFYTKRAQYTCVLLVAVCLLLLGASAKQLTVLVQPLTSTAGESLSVQPVLALTDDNGNILTTENDGTVIVSIGNNPSRFAGIYPLASAFTFENGIARCSGLYINEANVGFTLVFSSYYHGVRTETSSFDVVVGPRYRLAILADISTAYGGTPFLPQPTAGVVDKGGNVVAAVTESSVRIEIEVNPVGGVLQPAALLNVSIVGGIARFRGAFIDVAGSPYKLRYTTDLVLDGGSTVVTNPFTVAAGECSRLQFNTTLGEATGGKAFLIQPVLKLLDSGGNVLEADSSSKVRVTIAANPSRGTLTPADGLTVRVQKGVATFRSLKIDKAGNGYSLQFTLYTKVQGKNTWKKTTISQVSDTFDILTGNPVSLLLQRNLSDGILDGQPNEIQPIVALLDSGGNVVSSLETGTVTASLVSSASVSSSIVVDTSSPLLTVVNVRALINSAYPMAYGVGARVSVQVTFSDEVSIKGAPTLELESSANGAGANGKAVAVTTTTVWSSIYVFEYDVVATDNTLDLEYTSTTALSLNGGLITDRNGSANSLAGTSAVVIDTTAPVITSVSCPTPGDGEYGTGQQINLSVQFSQPVSVYGNPLLPVALTSVSGTGGTRNAVFSSGNNTNTLVFIYTVQSGDAAAKLDVTASINVNGGFIKHCSQRPTTDAVVTMAAVPVKLSSVNNIVIDTATPTIDATVGVTSGTSNGIYAPGDEIKILITFTKPVTVTGVTGYPRLFLETGPISALLVIQQVAAPKC